MSYSVDWIEPIYDRTYGDVLQAELNPSLINPKGCYNCIDLNRIENNTKYVVEYMLDHKIIRVPPSLAIKTNWIESDVPTRDDMLRIIRNVKLLMDLSNPIVQDKFDVIYESSQFVYTLANAIEKNLAIMATQPELPVQKWLLKVVNGIIQDSEGNTFTEIFLAEEETVTITGVASGEYVQYMTFTHWSGDTNDLQYIADVNSQSTTYTMQYHDYENYTVELTANYLTRLPRTLTLNGGTIYDDIGGNTRQFFAGDEILILADVAASGKRFYEWQGTEEGLDNLTGGINPSTAYLVMPDCDVELTSFYINAGQHKVTVDGETFGWYDYHETVYIYPASRGDRYTFAYWSGDTGYLEDTASSTFLMPDVNVSFTSHWNYQYSYNNVTIINGTIDGQTSLENVMQTSSHQIVANPAPEGQVFYKWSIEGLGSIYSSDASTATFSVGDGNAVITALYTPLRTVTIENEGNNGGTRSFQVGVGKTYNIYSSEVLSDYMFNYWERNGSRYGSRYWYDNIVMGDTDVTYHAYYRPRNSYTLTIVNGTGSGVYKERQSVSIQANPAPEGQLFGGWRGNYTFPTYGNNANTSISMPSNDCTLTATYYTPGPPVERIYHNLTVNNGSGSGSYYEGQRFYCYGNQAPDGYTFAYWTENDAIFSYSNPYVSDMGTSDREITANYKPIPYYTLTVINGKGSGSYKVGSQPQIIMDPAPEGMQFLQWEILKGDDNDVLQPLSENTTIRNLTHDITVKATYYVPDPSITYTLTVIGKDGEINTYNNPIGTQVNIYADMPDEGYKFYKWTGDGVQYVNDRYSENAVVNMPGKNISLEMEYRRIGFETTYHVQLFGGQLLLETDEDGTERWDIEGEFTEGSVVQIKAVDIPVGWRFNGWKNNEDGGQSVSTVNDLLAEETFLTVEDFDITLTRDVIEKDKYSMTIENGEVSGSYHEGDPVPVYFYLEDTDLTHYKFVKWSGSDLAYINLFPSGMFDVTKAEEQVVKMPARNIQISASYNASYRLSINSVEYGYYLKNEKVLISAEEIEGKTFMYWKDDTSSVDNPYNPNITVTMPEGPVNLIPVYTNENESNNIGYVLTDISNNDTIITDDITIISGEISEGFIITDKNGHIYVITNIIGNEGHILRLTTIEGGDSNGQ